jgi:RimJ/RimL family protein N-acetyltransferase
MSLAPLYGLRVRTPRLELRVPSDMELHELYELAAAGIHPPELMPFAVAWTDDLSREGFIAYHRSMRETWKPELWTLDLGTWADGVLVGVQGIGAEAFAERRTIGTGSWLGSRHQGSGIGTEMRAAVLEFAFGFLGARVVTSAAFETNAASLRVSEKLGYSIAGRESLSPRGTPQPHLLLRLEREDWTAPPMPVVVEGLEPCFPLFGAV